MVTLVYHDEDLSENVIGKYPASNVLRMAGPYGKMLLTASQNDALVAHISLRLAR